MMELLEVNHLRVAFSEGNKDYCAVNDISFTLGEKEVLGIVGESGCGKSITAQTLVGIQHPKAKILSGSVKLRGKELLHQTEDEWSKIRGKEISMIFQEPMTALNPLMSVGRQIQEVLWVHGLAKEKNQKEITLKMMEDVGLRDVEELYNSYPHELSGGMRQRIMIAMALIANPKMLIADEPTTALDATIQAQILRLFNRMKEAYEGSVIFISHDLGVVASICHRVIVMYAGRIVEIGSADELLSHPCHPYTFGLLRAIPSYTMRGKRLYNIPGTLPPLAERNFTGCPFCDRCEKKMKICFEVFPKPFERGNRTVYCHLFGEENHG